MTVDDTELHTYADRKELMGKLVQQARAKTNSRWLSHLVESSNDIS